MTRPRRLSIMIHSSAYGAIGTVQQLVSFKGVIRDREVGAWTLTAPMTPRNIVLLNSGTRIVVRDGAKIHLSGPMVEARLKKDSDWPDGVMTVSGVTDDTILAETLVLPDPARLPEQQTTQSHHRLSGTASTVIRDYARLQCGPDALVSGLVVRRSILALEADPGLGTAISGAGRYDNLLEFLQGLAVQGGVTFRVLANQSGVPVLRISKSVDRSASVILSTRFRNLRSGEWWIKQPRANAVITASQGDMTARTVVHYYDFASQMKWGRRIETFRDQRGESDIAQIAKDTLTALTEARETAAIAIEARETPRLQYGRDYDLGDTIRAQIVLDNGVFTGADVIGPVTEVEIEQGESAPVFKPLLGNGDATSTDEGVLQVQRLTQQLQALKAAK